MKKLVTGAVFAASLVLVGCGSSGGGDSTPDVDTTPDAVAFSKLSSVSYKVSFSPSTNEHVDEFTFCAKGTFEAVHGTNVTNTAGTYVVAGDTITLKYNSGTTIWTIIGPSSEFRKGQTFDLNGLGTGGGAVPEAVTAISEETFKILGDTGHFCNK